MLSTAAAAAGQPMNREGSGFSTPHRQSVPQPTQIEMLLSRQIQLLEEQLRGRPDLTYNEEYRDPFTLLKGLDPALQSVFKDWHKELKNTLNQLCQAMQLKDKYGRITERGELMNSFKAEAERDWPWPQSFLNKAVREALAPRGSVTAAPPGLPEPTFDLKKEWAQLRSRHARECKDFLVAYNGK